MKRHETRREFLQRAGQLAVAAPLIGLSACRGAPELELPAARRQVRSPFAPADEQLLEEIEHTAFLFFREAAHPQTGQVLDRRRAEGPEERRVSSIAATGFGLTGLCIADRRGYGSRDEIREQVKKTLRHLWERQPHERGFYYHFFDWETGERVWNCEVSSIDTSILLCGVLTCRQHFSDPEIRDLALRIYERVEWPWMLNDGEMFAMGWRPERGFTPRRWDHYCEHMMLYLLAIGSPTHPVPVATWEAWTRPVVEYAGYRYIGAKDPLFVHQFSHAWFDFRGVKDRHANYFENSIIATKAHRQFCLDLRDRFPEYGENLWGITASDSARGYRGWGGPPEHGELDGTVVPCAAGGSLPFLPQECLDVLRHIRREYGDTVWKRYGYVDAFNPHTGWVNKDVIGIDVGITMLMAENARTGFVWETCMQNVELQEAMDRVGFRPVG